MGGCSGFPSCFLGLLGFSVFLVRSAPACLGWGAGCGGFRGSGVGAPGRLASFSWGAGRWLASFSWGVGWGVRLRAPEWLASFLLGGVGSGVRVAWLPAVLWWGSGCARFPVRVRGVVVVFAGGFRVLFFSVRCFSCLPGSAVLGPLLGCGFRGVGGLWGVSGWVRGFSPASVVLARACLGLGWVLFGEFDPGSGRTLAACLTHASRTGPPLFLGVG